MRWCRSSATREQLAAQQAAARSARAAATLADLRYRSGLVDFQNVLQTQRTLLLADDSLAGITTTLATDHVRLYKALGGGWIPTAEEEDDTMSTPDPALDALLGPAGAPRPWWRRRTLWAVLALLVAGAAGTWFWLGQRQAAAAPQYTTQAATRGALTVTVTANGTLQPTTQVAIGSELSGTVARVHVDVNDRVKKGQVLVELDDARLRDQVTGSRAALAAAEAVLTQARATATEARDTLARLRDVHQRSGGLVPSATELAAAVAAAARGEANIASAQANVAQARATLSSNETNLSKAPIRSPIDGVVLSRSVEPGNAVAASLQAVTLFTLAEDLTKMKLQVNVDEADVGQVRERPGRQLHRQRLPEAALPGAHRARGLRLDDEGQRRHLPDRPAASTTTTCRCARA